MSLTLAELEGGHGHRVYRCMTMLMAGELWAFESFMQAQAYYASRFEWSGLGFVIMMATTFPKLVMQLLQLLTPLLDRLPLERRVAWGYTGYALVGVLTIVSDNLSISDTAHIILLVLIAFICNCLSALVQGPLYAVAASFPTASVAQGLELGNGLAGLLVNATNIIVRLAVAGVQPDMPMALLRLQFNLFFGVLVIVALACVVTWRLLQSDPTFVHYYYKGELPELEAMDPLSALSTLSKQAVDSVTNAVDGAVTWTTQQVAGSSNETADPVEVQMLPAHDEATATGAVRRASQAGEGMAPARVRSGRMQSVVALWSTSMAFANASEAPGAGGTNTLPSISQTSNAEAPVAALPAPRPLAHLERGSVRFQTMKWRSTKALPPPPPQGQGRNRRLSAYDAAHIYASPNAQAAMLLDLDEMTVRLGNTTRELWRIALKTWPDMLANVCTFAATLLVWPVFIGSLSFPIWPSDEADLISATNATVVTSDRLVGAFANVGSWWFQIILLGYNIFELLGKLLASSSAFARPPWTPKATLLFSLLRAAVLVPIFILSVSPWLIRTQWVALSAVLALGLTNGISICITMAQAPQTPSLRPEERGLAAGLMVAALFVGLALGSTLAAILRNVIN